MSALFCITFARVSLRAPKQLVCTTLQQVSFFVSSDAQRGHARGDLRGVYRSQVLNALLLKNPKLNYVDEILITPAERVETMARVWVDTAEVEQYRFRLGVALHAMKVTREKAVFLRRATEACVQLPRVLHPSALVPQKRPFDSAAVLSLANLKDFGLSSHVDFSAFVSLR